MSGFGCVAVKFADGDVVQVLSSRSNMLSALCFDGLFDENAAAQRRELDAIGMKTARPLGDSVAPRGSGLLAIDWQSKSVIMHLQDAGGFDRQFASRAVRQQFVRHAAAGGRARLAIPGKTEMTLTPQMIALAARMLDHPGSVKDVAGYGRVDWLTGDVIVDFTGWNVRFHRQDSAGFRTLLADLAGCGFEVDPSSQACNDWLDEIPQAA